VATTLADGLASAASLQEQWRFAAARETLVGVLGQATDGADRLAVVTGRRMFAEVLRDLGEVDEACAVAGPLVDDCEQRFGRNHPATARARTVLATTLHARGDLEAAADAYDQVLDGRFRETGPAGRAVRLARAYLALLQRDRGDPALARTGLEEAHRALRRAYGITDPDTIRFGTELGRMHREAGDVPAARRVLAVARAGCQATLDPWHPLCVFVERELTAVEPDLPEPARSTETMTREEWAARAAAASHASAPAPAPASARAADAAAASAPGAASPGGAPSGQPEVRKVPRYVSTDLAGHPPGKRARPEGHPPGERARPRARRRRLVVLALACVAAVAIVAVAALWLTGAWRSKDGAAPAAPTVLRIPTGSTPGGAPLRIQLRDDGTDLQVTWDDPDTGPAPVVIAVSRDGQPATITATVPAGTRQYLLKDLDPRAGYCVIAAADYPDQPRSPATSVCRQR
jgi:hypothetical protein